MSFNFRNKVKYYINWQANFGKYQEFKWQQIQEAGPATEN